jgi:hypothetical protein
MIRGGVRLEATATLRQSEQELHHNWQPGVHTRFGEKLYFYLLRLKSPLRGDEVEARIRRLLDAADIAHACEYAIYGDWDVLIRVWLSPSWKKQFLAALKRAGDTIDVRDFEANELRYLWTGDSADLLAGSRDVEAKIAERLDDIRAVAEEYDEVDPAARERLFGAGLLLPRPVTEGPDPVKFYICLKIYTDLKREVEVARVLDALEQAGLRDRASLYSGIGSFADHLIRCVANTYSEVMTLNAALSRALQDLDVRPMTLLVANGDARESDNINDTVLLTAKDDVVVGLLELSDRHLALLRDLPPGQRDALHTLVEGVYRASEGDMELRESLRDLLRACLKNDYREVRNALNFTLDFEWCLIEYLKRAWGAVYGRQWVSPLAKDLEAADGNSKRAALLRNIDKWSLADSVDLAIRSAEINDKVKAAFSKDLGQEWPPQMHTLKRIRNIVAHRLRKTPNFDEFTGDWGDLLSELMSVASLHFRIERLIDMDRKEPQE